MAVTPSSTPAAVPRPSRRIVAAVLVVAVLATALLAGVVLIARVGQTASDSPTVWQQITAGVTDGPVPRDVALEAFAYEFGVTIPGAHVPTGREGGDAPTSGTGAVRWVQGVWEELTPDQQAIIEPFLQPERGGGAIPVNVPGYSANVTSSANPSPGSAQVVLASDSPLRDAIVADLTQDLAHLGPKLGLPPIDPGSNPGTEAPMLGQVSVEISDEDHGTTLMYTYAAVEETLRHYSPCNVRIYHDAWAGEQPVNGGVSSRLHVMLTHEAVHCYQHALTGSVPIAGSMPAWISEGSAAWLAADDTRIEEPSLPSDWQGWFNPSDKELVYRTYDAVGFFSLLDHLGRNLWSLMVPAWRAAFADPPNASTAFLAVLGGDAPDVQQAWAPSLARRGDWGGPWEAHGFGLHADAQAHEFPMAASTEPMNGDLPPRSARLGEVPSADGEVVTVETTGLVSAHDDAGNEVLAAASASFCTVESCVCKPGTARAGEDVASQQMRMPFELAFFAPRDGSSYAIASHHLDELCGAAPTPRPSGSGAGTGPGAGGGNAGGAGSGGGDGGTDPCPAGCGQSNGDPHIVTVDGHLYDFQAAGEFTLLRGAGGVDEVQARQVPWPGSDHLAINTAVAARVGSHRVGVYDTAAHLELRVDGQPTPMEAAIDLAGGGRIVPYPSGVEVDFPDGTRLWALLVGRWGLMARIAPSAALSTTGVGILGPARGGLGVPALPDGSTLPAATDPNAAHAALYGTFADAWRVTGPTSLFDYAPGTSAATFALSGFPAEAAGSTLADLSPDQRAAGEHACAAITATDLHDSCVFDAGATGEADAGDAYALAQSFDRVGPAALAVGEPAPLLSSPNTPSGLSLPPGVAELVPEAQALLGQALGPDGRLYLSVRLADGMDAVVADDAMLISPPVQVSAPGGGPVAFAGGSLWVGETRPDGTCAIVRIEPHSLVTAATVPIPCDQGAAAIAALGDDVWYVDTSAAAPDGRGASLRRLDPSNQPSSTTIPIPISVAGSTLSQGTGAASIVLRSNAETMFLAKGATAFADLGPLEGPVFGVSAGVWAVDPGTSVARLHGPTGVVATRPISGHLVGADDAGILVEAPGSTADTLVQVAEGETPVLVAIGSQMDTAAGTTVPLGYADAWPLLVGDGHAVKLWLPISRTSASANAIDAEWSSIR